MTAGGFAPSNIPPDLPSDLRAALDRLATGVSRRDLAARAATQSQNYRAGGGSQDIRSRDDALAYAFARMPATYAAAVAVFNALREVCDFAPRSLLDVGAGPGTAAFAAVQAFPSLADIRLVEANAEMRALGAALFAESEQPALRAASYVALPKARRGHADRRSRDRKLRRGRDRAHGTLGFHARAVGRNRAGAGRDRARELLRAMRESSRCEAC